jgi:hypothetical protein
MTSITDKIQQVVSQEEKKLLNDDKFQKMKEFANYVQNLEKEGIIEKSSFKLPLSDTIGKNLAQSIKKIKKHFAKIQ